jgi:Telomeric repeat-binding factor 2.
MKFIVALLRQRVWSNLTLKKSLLLVLIGLFIMITATSCSDNKTNSTTVNDKKVAAVKSLTTSDESTKAKELEATKEPEKKLVKDDPVPVPGIGTPLQMGDVVFTVLKKSDSNKIGNDSMTKEASGRFLILEVSIKNEDKNAITIDSSFFKLKIGDVEFEVDGDADRYINSVDSMMFLQKVKPGVEIKGKVVFDIPADKVNSPDLLLNVQTGLTGTEKGIVVLK